MWCRNAARRAPQGDVRKAELPKSEIHRSEVRTSELPKSELRKSDAPLAQPIRRIPGLSYLLDKFADWANVIPGFRLFTIVLGMNPINQAPVERSGANILRGAVELIPIGDLLGFVREVPGLFIAALKSFVIQDLLDLPGALMRVAGMFADFVGKFIKWGLDAAWTLLEIVFDVVSPSALGYIKKTGAALKKILKNPLPFVGNLVKAAKLGLGNFADHIGTHLKNGLIEWLTGALTGVYLPKALSLAEIGKFALSVLGVTWLQIRGKIVKALGPTGEKIMSGLEKAADFIMKLINGGPEAAWDMIKEKLTDLKDSVIDGIKGFVESTVVKVAIPKLVAMFIPCAVFISAIISIYGTIKAFMEQLARIAAAVAAFIDSIMAIAEGQIAGAARKVEGALARVIPVAIGLLAGFLGLGGISDKVMGVVKKIQAVVDKALDTAIAWIIGKAKALCAKLFGGKDKDGKPDERTDEEKRKDLDKAINEATSLQKTPNITEDALRKGLVPIKSKYKMTSLELVVDNKDKTKETIHILGKINPDKPTDQSEIAAGDWPVKEEDWIKTPESRLAEKILKITDTDITYSQSDKGAAVPVKKTREIFLKLWNDKTILPAEEKQRYVAKYGIVVAEYIMSRGDLRANMQIIDIKEAHHLIPVSVWSEVAFLRQLVEDGWDPNAISNGIALAADFHSPHPIYSAYVLAKVRAWSQTAQAQKTPLDMARAALEGTFLVELRKQVELARKSSPGPGGLDKYFSTLP